MADRTYNRADIVKEQLDDAISLFERGSFVSALTLAGAAEETLGKMLSHSGKQNYLDFKSQVFKPLRTWLHGIPLSDFIRDEDGALLAVTRMASTSTPSITLDLEDAAHSMIVRALYNYDQLGLPRTARMLEFETLFYEYMVGPIIYAEEAIPA